jgi:uncharacterized cupredoxin-like copper-binding protein
VSSHIDEDDRSMTLSISRLIGVGAAALFVTTNAHAHANDQHVDARPKPARKEQTAWGIAGDAKNVRRTIEITMLDAMRFTPEAIDVRRGETIRLGMKNSGQLLHELVIGTREELDRHAALMAKFPSMEHDEAYMAHVAPGETGEIVWTFNRAGTFHFACLIPGHYESGMVGRIKVAIR